MPLANPEHVEDLSSYLTEALADYAATNDSTPSEIVSALFTVLDRTLSGIRKFQSSDERFHNAREISRFLEDLQTNYGKVPS